MFSDEYLPNSLNVVSANPLATIELCFHRGRASSKRICCWPDKVGPPLVTLCKLFFGRPTDGTLIVDVCSYLVLTFFRFGDDSKPWLEKLYI